MDKMSSDEIYAGFGQFKKAFDEHWKNGSTESSQSHYMLRFYSVECGLKSMYIHKSDKSHKITSKDMPKHGHRLELWIKELKIPASISPPPQFTLHSASSIRSPLTIYRAHEAWRYGVAMNPSHERKIVEWLERVGDFIRESLKEA